MKTLKGIAIGRQLKVFSRGKVQVNKSLSSYTSIKIGGRAALFIEPKDNIDLVKVVKFFRTEAIPYRIIGNGTNLLINDRDLNFAVIKLSSLWFNEISIKENVLFMRGGVSLPKLLNFSIKNGICGLEFLAGIPGTAGGALVMNAGIRNPHQQDNKDALYLSISDLLIEVEVMDAQGGIFKLAKKNCGFTYRGSELKELIVLGAYFKVNKSTADKVLERIKDFLKRRRIFKLQCLSSAGCVFKNPEGSNISAGELIECAKLKGQRIGQAQVSQTHANFIVNLGDATFLQVYELMNIVREKVKKEAGVNLEHEVEIWDNKRQL